MITENAISWEGIVSDNVIALTVADHILLPLRV